MCIHVQVHNSIVSWGLKDKILWVGFVGWDYLHVVISPCQLDGFLDEPANMHWGPTCKLIRKKGPNNTSIYKTVTEPYAKFQASSFVLTSLASLLLSDITYMKHGPVENTCVSVSGTCWTWTRARHVSDTVWPCLTMSQWVWLVGMVKPA